MLTPMLVGFSLLACFLCVCCEFKMHTGGGGSFTHSRFPTACYFDPAKRDSNTLLIIHTECCVTFPVLRNYLQAAIYTLMTNRPNSFIKGGKQGASP